VFANVNENSAVSKRSNKKNFKPINKPINKTNNKKNKAIFSGLSVFLIVPLIDLYFICIILLTLIVQ
jgi:hypothetical protein